ncbi:MAG TPA: FprA family A-type flavoprotein [Candidatus Mailhella excrementigallinarum]|nr:MAG: MBL fold metallo-hydrolase [Desulfovibrionaceae bacterium]HIV67076.1 FprA family A-type flavoprotein [Candidatus Mailhella excrementigallinarum]
MQPVLLKPGIHWVGAVDFNLRNFHHYSRSPEGSTYNAYLIQDEKNVLVDTVSHHYFDELVAHISALVDPRKIDYIICNHLEQDHAGVLPRIVELCKPEKIFCSTMGLKSITRQFNTEGWPITAVKDGERLNIGKRNITFLETRMLHWPDSMVSYVEEDRVLFSNDAFGQNVATSRRFVDEYERPLLLRAMKDYYNNIVLPYSPMVLKTLDRVVQLGIPLDIIAPDHGLIFRTPEDIRFVLDSYRAFAEQKPKLRAVVAYESMWGATESMAYAVGDGLDDEGVPYVLMDMQHNHVSAVMNELADSGALILGSATRNNMPMVNMMALMAHVKGLKPQNLVGATFGAHGWSGEAPRMMAEELAAMKVEVVGEPVRAHFGAKAEELAACRELGAAVARTLKEKVKAFA